VLEFESLIDKKKGTIESMCKKIVSREIKKGQQNSSGTKAAGSSTDSDPFKSQLTKFFQNYALELYGASLLEATS
jgi:hypothetical protein